MVRWKGDWAGGGRAILDVFVISGTLTDSPTSGDVNEMHQCLNDASLDFGLKMKYLPVPENRNVVIPCFELSAKFSSGLNLCFNNKQYESVLQALSGWTGKMAADETSADPYGPSPNRSRKASFGVEKPSTTSRRSSSVVPPSKNAISKRERKDRADFQLLADVEIPKLKIDLKTDFSADVAAVASGGQPLVSILCETMSITYRKTKPHICVVETSMASFMVLDLLEGSVKTPNLPYMAKASGGVRDVSAVSGLGSLGGLSVLLVHFRLALSIHSYQPRVRISVAMRRTIHRASYCLRRYRVRPPPQRRLYRVSGHVFRFGHSQDHIGASFAVFLAALKQLFPATPPPTPTLRYETRRRSEEPADMEKWRRSATPASSKSSFPSTTEEKKRQKRDQGQYSNQCPVRVLVTLVDSVHEDFQDGFKQVSGRWSVWGMEAGCGGRVRSQQ